MSTVHEIVAAVKALSKGDFDEILLAVLRQDRELGSRLGPRRFSDEEIAAWTADDEQGMEAFHCLRSKDFPTTGGYSGHFEGLKPHA